MHQYHKYSKEAIPFHKPLPLKIAQLYIRQPSKTGTKLTITVDNWFESTTFFWN
jgi:hypothetical protein